MTKAAVFNAVQEPLTIEEIDVAEPVDREVLVRTAASGVCHSDLHFIEGLYPMPNRAILGHEAAGVVEAVGPNVTEVEPGDHVIACLSVFCGQCDYCLTGRTHLCSNRPARTAEQGPRLSQDGKMLTQFASIGSYSEQMLLHENGIVKIDKDFPFAQAALIGCAAPTPVVTPQPISAACANGMSSSIFTMPFSCSSIISAYEATLANCPVGVPLKLSRGGSSAPRAGRLLQRCVCPVRQRSH